MREPKERHLFLISPKPISFLCVCNSTTFDISNVLQHLLNSYLLGNKNSASISSISLDCVSSKLAKSKVLLIPSYGSHALHIFEFVHSDVWSLAPMVSHNHCKYFVTSTNNYSHMGLFSLCKERFSIFQVFIALIDNQFSSIGILRSYSGGEY